jgi:hypothetical protein
VTRARAREAHRAALDARNEPLRSDEKRNAWPTPIDTVIGLASNPLLRSCEEHQAELADLDLVTVGQHRV